MTVGISDLALSLLLGFLQLIFGLVFAIGSVYLGLKVLDKLTVKIDEWKEIRRGNVAVGIYMAAVIFSLAAVLQAGIGQLTATINPAAGMKMMALGLLLGLTNLVIGMAAAIVAVYLAIKVLDMITIDFDEFNELKKGNVAVAIIMAGVLLAVSFVIQAAVFGIAKTLDPSLVAQAFKLPL